MTPSALVLSFVEWRGAFQRPHHLVLGLARRGWQVTYAAPRYIHREKMQVGSGLRLPRNLHVLQPPALPGVSRFAAIERLNGWLMRRALRRSAHPGGPQGGWDLVIYNDPRLAHAAAQVEARQRIFDCMDDLSAQVPNAGALRRTEDTALALAGRIWTGTWQLAERLGPAAAAAGKPLHFIPCGVDAEHFANPAAAPADLLSLLPPGPGPLAGYFGVVNERIDTRLLAALLDAGWRVLLIGPTTSRTAALPRDPRLRWIGPRPYAELPAWLAAFDLALIPYDFRGPHRFLYPVKALEYLAAAKPVLSTPLPDVVRFLGGFVELADTPHKWREAGQRLLAERTTALQRAAAGQAYARSRTWDAMVDDMLADCAAAHPQAAG